MSEGFILNDRRGLGNLERACPVRTAIDVIGGRWKPSILELLNEGSCRHRDLLKSVAGISSQALSMQLRQLSADGVIEKGGADGSMYRLTASGQRLAIVMDGLANWGGAYLNWREGIADRH